MDAHLAVVSEMPNGEVRHDHARAAPEPTLLTPDPLGLLGPAEVAGRRPEVDALDERAGRLPQDHEDLAGVDRNLAGAAAARQPGPRGVVVADDRRVQVPEAVDLGRAEKPNVDEAALQVEAEQLVHRGHGG